MEANTPKIALLCIPFARVIETTFAGFFHFPCLSLEAREILFGSDRFLTAPEILFANHQESMSPDPSFPPGPSHTRVLCKVLVMEMNCQDGQYLFRTNIPT